MARYQLLLPLLSLLNTCQKDGQDFSLTPATQTGANTLSCKVDGQVFRPYGKRCTGYGGGCEEGVRSYYDPKRGQLTISAILCIEGRSQRVRIEGDSIFGVGEAFVQHPTMHHYATVNYTDEILKTSYHSTPFGHTSIVITHLDTVAHIISGTYEGDLKLTVISSTNEKPAVLVTEGRFDVTYY